MADKKKIFVADDDEQVLSTLDKSLTANGFEVKVTTNAEEIMPTVKSFRPDLILLDLRMPHLGGFEICEMLNKDKETQGIPIIIVSGIGDLPDIQHAYKLGVVNYFTKSSNIKELIKEINQALAYKQGA